MLWMPGMGADPKKRGSSAVPKKATIDDVKKKPESKKGKDWRYLPRADVNRSAAARGPTRVQQLKAESDIKFYSDKRKEMDS